MLNTSSLVVIVGGGPHPAFSVRSLQVWNTKTKSMLAQIDCESSILRVLLNRQRLVVVLSTAVQIYNLDSLTHLITLETPPNPRGIAALSPNDRACHLCLPSSATSGDLLVYNALTLNVCTVVKAHKGSVVAVAISQCGSRLATASETGTVIRVFRLPSGEPIHTFRRGTQTAVITSLSFYSPPTVPPDSSPTLPKFLCVASTSGTVHVFKLDDTAAGTGDESVATAASADDRDDPDWTELPMSLHAPSEDMKPLGTKMFDAVVSGARKLSTFEGDRSFAQVKLKPGNVPALCGITINSADTPDPSGRGTTLFLSVVSANGVFHQHKFDPRIGGDCKLEREFSIRDDVSEVVGVTLLP